MNSPCDEAIRTPWRFGSQINARYGLTAAQEILPHADVAVTAAHYVENKKRSILGFGHLLKSDRTIIPIGEGSGVPGHRPRLG